MLDSIKSRKVILSGKNFIAGILFKNNINQNKN